jgi:hypothetical protein
LGRDERDQPGLQRGIVIPNFNSLDSAWPSPMQDPFQTSARIEVGGDLQPPAPHTPFAPASNDFVDGSQTHETSAVFTGTLLGADASTAQLYVGGCEGFGVEYYMFALGERIPVLVEEVISSPGVHLDVVFPATGSTVTGALVTVRMQPITPVRVPEPATFLLGAICANPFTD